MGQHSGTPGPSPKNRKHENQKSGNQVKAVQNGPNILADHLLRGEPKVEVISSGAAGFPKGNPRDFKASVEPVLGLPDGRTVTIKLAHTETEAACSFWVGLTKVGSGNASKPHELLGESSVESVFQNVVAQGVSESGPIMLADSERSPARFVFLVPLPGGPGGEFRDRAVWVTNVVETIRSWAPRTAGFYLAPELMATPLAQELLLQVLRELIVTSLVTDFYLLVGNHGYNSILNCAMNLKTELGGDSLNLLVFH